GLREQKKNDDYEDIAQELDSLIRNKISALKNAEKAVNDSPRLLRIDSPRLHRSPVSPKTSPSMEARAIPTIRDFTIVKTITEGAFGYDSSFNVICNTYFSRVF